MIVELSKCMGLRRFDHQCATCGRLPLTPEDEDSKRWTNPPDEGYTCIRYRNKLGNNAEVKKEATE